MLARSALKGLAVADEGGHRFEDSSQDTQWSMYVDGAHAPGPQLNRLLLAYSQRLTHHARRHWGYQLGSELDDVIQSFFTKFLEGNIVRHARRERGRFRDFLRRCFDNWVKDYLRGKRMGQLHDSQIADEALVAATDFERMWCEEVLLESAIVAKQYCAQHGRSDIWYLIQDQTLSPILAGTNRLTHAELMKKYNLLTENVAAGKVRTAKKWFEQSLKEVIQQYVADEDVDEELREFFRVLPAAMRDADGLIHRHQWLERELNRDLKDHDLRAWNDWFANASPTERELRTYAEALTSAACSLPLLTLIKDFAKKQARADNGVLSTAAATPLYLVAISTARFRTRSPDVLSSFSNQQLIERLEDCIQTSLNAAATELMRQRLEELKALEQQRNDSATG